MYCVVFILEMTSFCDTLIPRDTYIKLIEESKSELRKYVIKNGLIKVRMATSGDIGLLSKLNKDILDKISTKL